MAIQGEELTRAVLDRLKRLDFFAITELGTAAFDVGVVLIDNVDPVVDIGFADPNDDPAHDHDFDKSGGGGAGSPKGSNPKESNSGKKSGTGSSGATGSASQSSAHAGSGVLAESSASRREEWSENELRKSGLTESDLPISAIRERGLAEYRES